MEELMITIPLDRYEELHDLETRATLLMEYTQEQHYAVDREKVAHYLNFKLRQHPAPDMPMSFAEMLGKEIDDGKCDCGKETESDD